MIDKTRNQFSMNMAIFLASLGATLWTRLSHTQNALLASVVSVGDFSQQYHGIVSRALPV